MITYEEAHKRWTYDPLTGVFYWKIRAAIRTKVGSRADVSTGREGAYRCLFVSSKKLMAHKVAWLMTYGEWSDFEMDHRDCDGTNNAIANLRKADRSLNACNRRVRSDSNSGVRGVMWHKKTKKWTAIVVKDGKVKFRKYFHSLDDAAAAYREAADKYHGAFARHQ